MSGAAPSLTQRVGNGESHFAKSLFLLHISRAT